MYQAPRAIYWDVLQAVYRSVPEPHKSEMIKHLVSLSRGQRVDIVDVQCSTGRESHLTGDISTRKGAGSKGGLLL